MSLIDKKPGTCQCQYMEFMNAKFIPDVLKVEALQQLSPRANNINKIGWHEWHILALQMVP